MVELVGTGGEDMISRKFGAESKVGLESNTRFSSGISISPGHCKAEGKGQKIK